MFKSLARRVIRAARVVIYDPEVQRAGKSLAALVAVRLLIAASASAQLVEFIQRILGA